MNKITKRDVFNAVIAMVDGKTPAVAAADIKAAMENEIRLLDKKSKKASGPKKEFVDMEAKIVEILTATPDMDATAIGNKLGVSSQKVSPRLTALVDANKITFAKVKGKKFYTVA